MPVTASRLLWYWDAAYGVEPIHGGPSVANFTRDGVATFVDARRMVHTLRPGLPRMEWVPDGAGEYRPALRLEGATLNYAYPSNDLGAGGWVHRGGVLAVSPDPAPDGGPAVRVTLGAAGVTDLYLLLGYIGVPVMAGSVWARTVQGGASHLIFANPYNSAHNFLFVPPAAGEGWRRYSGRYADSAGNNGVFLCAGGGTWTGDLWGVGLENSLVASSLVATTTEAAARAADKWHWTGAPPPQAMAIYTRCTEAGTAEFGGSARVWQIGSATNGVPSLILYHTGAGYQLYHHNGGAVSFSEVTAVPVRGDTVELLALLYADGRTLLQLSVNGGPVQVAPSQGPAIGLAPAWSAPQWWLNSAGDIGAGYGCGLFQRICAVPLGDLDGGVSMDAMRAIQLAPGSTLLAAP